MENTETNTINLEKTEIDNLNKILAEYRECTLSLGQLSLNKDEIDEMTIKVKQIIKENKMNQDKWLAEIKAKYGTGSIDLKSGTFTKE